MPNTNLDITLRNKAKTLLEHCSEDTLVAAIRQFLKMQHEDAFDLLWRLKYNPEEAKDNILKELGLSLKMVPNLSLLESELGYQYRQHVDTTFLKTPKQSDMTKAVLRAFNALYEAPELGHCTAIYVYRACVAYQSLANADIGRVQHLLGRSEENCFFGGIQELLKAVCPKLGERKIISNYLKPHAVKILELFTALTEEKKKPMSDLLQIIQAAGKNLPTEEAPGKEATVVDVAKEEAPKENPKVNLAPLFAHIADVQNLIDAARVLEQNGINPVLILSNSNREEILEALRYWDNARQAQEEAQQILEEAHQAQEEAQQILEEARQAQEKAQRILDNARQTQEKAQRTQENSQQIQEEVHTILATIFS